MKEEFQYNLKITIKCILMYENLTGKPFNKFFDEVEENIIPFIYCVLYSHKENKIQNTYEEILPLLSNEKILEPIAIGIKKEFDILKQFGAHRDTSTNDTVEILDSSIKSDQNTSHDIFVKDYIPVLTSDCGLDINYIMNEMNYTDIDTFIKYREQKHQAYLEEQRLFTYMNTMVHVDPKKAKNLTVEKWLPFP